MNIDINDAAHTLDRILAHSGTRDLRQYMYQDDLDNFVTHAYNIDLEPYPNFASALQYMHDIYYDHLQEQIIIKMNRI